MAMKGKQTYGKLTLKISPVVKLIYKYKDIHSLYPL